MSALSGGVGCVNKIKTSRPPQEADQTVRLEVDATGGPSSIRIGYHRHTLPLVELTIEDDGAVSTVDGVELLIRLDIIGSKSSLKMNRYHQKIRNPHPPMQSLQKAIYIHLKFIYPTRRQRFAYNLLVC